MAFVAPKFTVYGLGLVRAPKDLMVDLRQAIHDGLHAGPREEKPIKCVDTEEPSWFIDRPDLLDHVVDEMQSIPETWANTELKAWGGKILSLPLGAGRIFMISRRLFLQRTDYGCIETISNYRCMWTAHKHMLLA